MKQIIEKNKISSDRVRCSWTVLRTRSISLPYPQKRPILNICAGKYNPDNQHQQQGADNCRDNIYQAPAFIIFNTDDRQTQPHDDTGNIDTAPNCTQSIGQYNLQKYENQRCKGQHTEIRAAILIFCNFFFSMVYLISFLPNLLTANKRANIKTTIAHGKNGNTENAVPVPSAVKSCSEQDTR